MNPNIRKKSIAVSKNKNQLKPNSNLITARTGLFYGLVIKKTLNDKISVTSGLSATPNVIFNSGQTGAFFDFSDWRNDPTTEESFDDFWKVVSRGASFTVSNGEVYNTKNEQVYDISGTYTLTEIENMIVIAGVSSVQNIESDISLYSKMDFRQTPIFEISATPQTGDSTTSVVINTFGTNSKSSFSYLGASVGDFVMIQGNDIPYEILELREDSEGREILIVKGQLSEQNNIGKKIMIQILVKVAPNQESIKPNLEDTTLGSCKTIKDGIIISCVENQTEDQCLLRKKGSISATFNPGLSCGGITNITRQSKTNLTPSTSSNDEVVARLLRDISAQVGINPKSGRVF